MLFLHSYQFINNDKLDTLHISDNQLTILDNDKTIIGLSNIPNNKSLYKVILSNVTFSQNNFYNLKIQIKINYDKLYDYVKYNKTIPNKLELISLIKRNLNTKKKILYHYSNLKNIKFKNDYELIFYKDDIVKLKDIYIDINTGIFSLNNNSSIINLNINGFILIGNFDYIHIQKIMNSRCKNLILTEKKYKAFLNLKFNNKFTVVHEIDSNIYRVKWNNILIYNYYNFDIDLTKINYKKKIMLYDKLDNNYINNIVGLFLNDKSICYNNYYNQVLFKNFIFLVKTDIINKLIKKSIKLNINERKYKDNIEKKNLHEFMSFPNNFIHYNYILKNDFLKKYKKKYYCSICLNNISTSNLTFTPCNHFFCYECIFKVLKNSSSCPNCRNKITLNALNIVSNTKISNSKLNYILDKLIIKKEILVLSNYNNTLQNLKNMMNKSNITKTIINNKIDYIKLTNIDNINFIKNIKKCKLKNIDEILFMDTDNVNFNYYFNILYSIFLNKCKYVYLCSK